VKDLGALSGPCHGRSEYGTGCSISTLCGRHTAFVLLHYIDTNRGHEVRYGWEHDRRVYTYDRFDFQFGYGPTPHWSYWRTYWTGHWNRYELYFHTEWINER